MRSIEHYKTIAHHDGRRSNLKDKFLFQECKSDTAFVMFDEFSDNSDFGMLFSSLTGDFSFEAKYQGRITIPSKRRPKMGITSNFILDGDGHSYDRRQHVVQFGPYFSDMDKDGKSILDIYGCYLFDEKQGWTTKDWNEFFNFGFRCVQESLNRGLVPSDTYDYQTKQLVKKYGEDATDWILGFINRTPDQHPKGLSIDQVFEQFKSSTQLTNVNWDKKKFKKALFDTCVVSPDRVYNPRKTGKTLTDKKDVQKVNGKTVEWLIIGKK